MKFFDRIEEERMNKGYYHANFVYLTSEYLVLSINY